MRRTFPLVVLLVIGLWVSPAHASTITFNDDFEAGTFSPFWSLTQQNGTIELSTDQSVSGVQSAKLTALGGGQVNVWLTHTFPESSRGTLSVKFYDTGAGTYAGLYANDSSNLSNSFASNVADWSAGYGRPYIWSGPGVGETQTSVLRTPGWHELRLEVTPTVFNAFVDNTLTGSVNGSYTFDTVLLLVQAPGQTGTFYFDDFSATVESIPEPSALALLGVGLAALVRRTVRKA